MELAIFILARDGSKRIPKKNIIDFAGKPLIMWTVETAEILSKEFEIPIYVFTDMQEIRELLKDKNVILKEKLFESKSGLHKTGEELLQYNIKIGAEHIILLQPTSPIRNVNAIIEWIKIYLKDKYKAGVACKKLGNNFYYRNNFALYESELRNYNSNVMEPIYKETGSFYIFHKHQIQKNHFLNTDRLIVFEDSFDIDIDSLKDIDADNAYKSIKELL